MNHRQLEEIGPHPMIRLEQLQHAGLVGMQQVGEAGAMGGHDVGGAAEQGNLLAQAEALALHDHEAVWFEQGDVNQTPMMLESKPTHAAPTSDFAPLTMQEFFLTAFGTLIAWEALFALYARLAIRRNDDES